MEPLLDILTSTVMQALSILFILAIILLILDSMLEKTRNLIEFHWCKFLLKRSNSKYVVENDELKSKIIELMRRFETAKAKRGNPEAVKTLLALSEKESLSRSTIKELLFVITSIDCDCQDFENLIKIICSNFK